MDKEQSTSSLKFALWLAVITCLAAFLRLWKLSEPSLGTDELYSIRDATLLYQDPIGTAFSMVRVIGYIPITLSLLLNGVDLGAVDSSSAIMWQDMGVTPFAIRLIPAIIGILTVPILGWLSRPLFGVRGAIIAALLLAFAPWHIYWSQMGRFYITQFLFYNLALLLYFSATEKGSKKQLLWAMVFLILAFNTQYTTVVIFFVILGDWFLSKLRRDTLLLDFQGYLIVFLTTLFCGGMFLYGSSTGRSGLIMIKPQYDYPVILVRNFFWLLFFIGPTVLIMSFVPRMISNFNNRRLLNYLLLGAILPIIALIPFSYRAWSDTRYVFTCLYPLLGLTAIGLACAYDQLLPRFGRIGALFPTILVFLSLILVDASYFLYNKGFRPRFADAASYVIERYQAGDKVVMSGEIKNGEYFLSKLGEQAFAPRLNMDAIDDPLWIVIHGKELKGSIFELFSSRAILKETFPLYVMKPVHHVSVYYVPKKTSEDRL